MTKRTRAEIEAEMNAQLGLQPVGKRTRAEIEAEMNAKLSPKVPSVQEYLNSPEGKAELSTLYSNMESDNTFGQNMAIGAGNTLYGYGRGAQQVLARLQGDDAKLKALQEEEATNRIRMRPVAESGGGILGNIAANSALMFLPGGAVTKGAQALTKGGLLAAMLGEGAMGAATGALTPTVEGESALENAKSSALLNAMFPAAGAALKSGLVQKAAGKVMDYNPLLAATRRKARNLELDKAYEAAKEQFNAAKENIRNSTKIASSLRAGSAQQKLAENAGWSKWPTTKMEAEDELRRVGKAYGDLIEPVRMPMPDVQDLVEAPGSKIGYYAQKLNNAADDAGVPGDAYKAVRSDVNRALEDAQGIDRDQLLAFRDRIDKNFESSLPKEMYDQVVDLRQKYALGATMADADWHPGKGADLGSLRKRLDNRSLRNPEARQNLYDVIQEADNAKVAEKKALEELEFDRPVKPAKEGSDIAGMYAANAAAMAGLGSVLGLPSAGLIPAIHGGAMLIGQAKNPKVANTVNALRRGVTMGYGTVLAQPDTGDQQ